MRQRPGGVAAVLTVALLAWLLGLGTASAQHHETPVEGAEPSSPTEHDSHQHPAEGGADSVIVEADLAPSLQATSLVDGDNLVLTTEDGIRLSAQVVAGEVVAWVAADSSGQPLPTSYKKNISFDLAGVTYGQSTQHRESAPTEGCCVCLTPAGHEERCFAAPCEAVPEQ